MKDLRLGGISDHLGYLITYQVYFNDETVNMKASLILFYWLLVNKGFEKLV